MRQKKTVNVEIGANIKTARQAAGYTQEKLAEELGFTTNQISAVECGASGVTIETLRRLCGILGVSADALLFGSTEIDNAALHFARRLENVPPEKRALIDKALSAVLNLA